MNLIKTKIEGLIILKLKTIEDNRGYFFETYNKNSLKILNNINFVQENESKSHKGVLRGLHYQKPPFSQSKLVRCVQGKVLDVALDLRKNSDTFGLTVSTILSQDNKKQLFIPKGFAHGFIVLSDSAIISYKVDNYYNPDFEDGVLWNDKDLKINWILEKDKIMISEKDKKLPTFKETFSPFQ